MGVLLMAGLVGLSTSDRILTSYAIDYLYQVSLSKESEKASRYGPVTSSLHLPIGVYDEKTESCTMQPTQ